MSVCYTLCVPMLLSSLGHSDTPLCGGKQAGPGFPCDGLQANDRTLSIQIML